MSVAILGDWGTTRLRLFLLRDGAVVDRLSGPGIGHLTASPAETLIAAIAPWADDARAAGVLLCGMAGSQSGLAEAPYAALPVAPAQWARAAVTLDVAGIPVTIAAGLSGANFAGRCDVMRGEETQIFGAIALAPALGGGRRLLVLPGTHSKWAELIDGCVHRFHTFPTGELFGLLRDHSTLTRAGADPHGWEQGFEAGLIRAEAGLIAGMFESRAAQLVEGRNRGWALGMLSGLLIGSEVRESTALLGDMPRRIGVIGDPALSAHYTQALATTGIEAEPVDGDACAIAGLRQLAKERGEP